MNNNFEVIIEDANDGLHEWVLIGPAYFNAAKAGLISEDIKKLIDVYKLELMVMEDGSEGYFERSINSDYLVGRRKKMVDEQKAESVGPIEEAVATVGDVVEKAFDVVEEVASKVDDVVEEVVAAAGEVLSVGFPNLNPEDANAVKQAWELGPLPQALIDWMLHKYNVRNATLTHKEDGNVSFVALPTTEVAA